MIQEKVSLTKGLLTDNQKNWDHFDKKYCFKIVKSITERIKAVIKTQKGGLIETMETDLLTVFWESWNYFNEEYGFKIVKSLNSF